ncbi:polysaccharide biosynthesis tyrosine autokinase [Brachybacterium sp. UMB0905]|uniref:polysaccharide biosynthesis tyrosine autokinase n=1 Tax=Brachybacterium sp. UMB0905 TaxID=2069310 RepID=UPI000C80C1C5|nr:polysaccharide biosynthesis tyrosine autokinase [Brachybacterium sp. UMB0905]PMC74780.1 chromosome partitioning protein [Brachybacterium sp. UMB0905]
MPSSNEWKTVELQNYLAILRDRWISALVTFLLVLGAVVGFTLMQTPTYQATNRLFVQTQAGSSVTDLNSGVTFARQQITSYADLATTPLVLEPVIEDQGLDSTPQQLAGMISTTVPPETLILEITVTDEDPQQAATIADATAESLRERVSELESNGEDASVELTVITPATVPTSPASPSLTRNLAIGVVLGLMAAVAMAIVRDLLDNRVRRAEDLERTFERPVIAKIPYSRDTKHLPLIASQHPQSVQAEAYRDLRTNLQFMGLAEGKRSVLLTSSLPAEGKTSSAINLAHVVAQSGGKVLLIDADLRRPSLHHYMGLEGNAGLTTVLIGEADLEDVIQPMATDGLDVLASGPIPPNPSEILGSEAMEQLLAQATAEYDYVIVDAPPLLAVTDSVVLSRLVGGALVVARSEHVRRHQLQQALEKLEAVDAKILGIVLNRVPTSGRSSYRYNYSYTTDGSAVRQSVAKEAPSAPAKSLEQEAPAARGDSTGRHTAPAARAADPQPEPEQDLWSLPGVSPVEPASGKRRADVDLAGYSSQKRSWPGAASRGQVDH